MDATDILLSASSDPALIPCNPPADFNHDDHQMMSMMIIPSQNHGDDDQLMISPNSDQTPYALDNNIDWANLLSPLPPAEFEPSSLPMLLSSSSSTPSLSKNNTNNGGCHDHHQMVRDELMAEINNGGGPSINGEGHGERMNKSSSLNFSHNYKQNSVMKKKGATPRIAFYTKSEEDVLDDGYKWRKYGQKSVKNSAHPRSYYRCTYHTCNVKKQIQRQSRDKSIVITTYEGIHNHPSEKLMETLSPLLKQLQFLSRF